MPAGSSFTQDPGLSLAIVLGPHGIAVCQNGAVVYDLAADTGWVSVGTDHDTAAFAVETIRRWWASTGPTCYPQASRLLITADGGGSNGYRTRLWKTELAALATEVQAKRGPLALADPAAGDVALQLNAHEVSLSVVHRAVRRPQELSTHSRT